MKSYVELIEKSIAYIQTLMSEGRKGNRPPGAKTVESGSQTVEGVLPSFPRSDNSRAIFSSKRSLQHRVAPFDRPRNSDLHTVDSPLFRSDGKKGDQSDLGVGYTDTAFRQVAGGALTLSKASENRKKGNRKHPPHTALPHGRLGAALRALDPTLLLYAHPPSDEKAKRIKNAWNKNALISEISILFDKPHYDPFLSHVAKAISCRFAPSQLVEISSFEMEKKWDLFLKAPHLRLVLCPKQLMFNSRELLKFYRENSTQKKLFLGNIPLLLLSNPSSYKRNPNLKPLLWNLICQMLS